MAVEPPWPRLFDCADDGTEIKPNASAGKANQLCFRKRLRFIATLGKIESCDLAHAAGAYARRYLGERSSPLRVPCTRPCSCPGRSIDNNRPRDADLRVAKGTSALLHTNCTLDLRLKIANPKAARPLRTTFFNNALDANQAPVFESSHSDL